MSRAKKPSLMISMPGWNGSWRSDCPTSNTIHVGPDHRQDTTIETAIYLREVLARVTLPPPAEIPDEGEHSDNAEIWKAWLILFVGLGLLLVAAELTVASATSFAEQAGMSNIAVSAIIIGMGSSLPELSVSFVALLRKRGGLSVGNLVGSNVLDTLLVPGVAAVISPLAVPVAILWVDLPVLLLTTVLVLGFLYVSRRGIRSIEAMILLTIYLVYAAVRLVGPGS